MIIENNSKLVMIGDSITDCQRNKPIGEGLNAAHGTGYVSVVNALLSAAYPEKRIRVVNMGTSGNTVRDLQNRWETDVFDLKPDWLSIMIGINDVWRQCDMPNITEKHVYLDEYEKTLENLVKITLPTVKGLILMTPYFLEPNTSDTMRAEMDKYGAVVRKLSEKYNTYFVDTQAAFSDYLKHYHAASLAWDRVHPNLTGHTIIARAFLNAIGFCWDGK